MDRREFIYLGVAGALGASTGSLACKGSGNEGVQAGLSGPQPKLELNFEGLLAFARPKPGQSAWSVILVRTDDLQQDPQHPIEKHWPLLRMRTAHVHPSTTPPPPPPAGAPNVPDGFFQWDLTDTEVTVLRDGQPAGDGVDLVNNTRPTDTATGKPVKCSLTEHSDVSWLADLKLACGNGTLRPALLTQLPGPGVPLLGARVRVGDGKMSCAQTTGNVNAIFTVNNDYEQSLADVVSVEVQPKGKPLSLRLRRGTQTTDIVFNGTEQKVVAQLRNMVGGSPPPVDPKADIHHFAAFYQLLATTPPSKPIPKFKSDCVPVGGGGQPAQPGQPSPLDPPFYCPPVTGDAP